VLAVDAVLVVTAEVAEVVLDVDDVAAADSVKTDTLKGVVVDEYPGHVVLPMTVTVYG
jgi:hypothetical protein